MPEVGSRIKELHQKGGPESGSHSRREVQNQGVIPEGIKELHQKGESGGYARSGVQN